MKGPDGVRSRDRQRLEFEYSTTPLSWRIADEAILQRNFMAIGIKLDIQNYNPVTFFESLLPGVKASPPTGAVSGRYDIAEVEETLAMTPTTPSWACDQAPSIGGNNYDFYCNPALDGLYKQEQTTADVAMRQQIFRQIHQL